MAVMLGNKPSQSMAHDLGTEDNLKLSSWQSIIIVLYVVLHKGHEIPAEVSLAGFACWTLVQAMMHCTTPQIRRNVVCIAAL